MHDAPFYLSMFAVSAVIAQMPDVDQFKELSATIILGILFWYTLTRINGGIQKLTEAIIELRETIENREKEKENS